MTSISSLGDMKDWSALPLAMRNAAFDVNSAVKDSAALAERRNRLSESYRECHGATLDVPYADHSGNCAFDLYPASNPDAPCLVFIHGGWWQRNGRQNFACYANGLAQCGWSVAMPGYTLAPASNLTDIVAEIGMALDWLVSEGARFGIAGPLVIGGWSAGAHLASLHLGHPGICAGLAVAGIYELQQFRQTSFNDAVRLTDAEVRNLSPIRRDPVAKPMTIAVGSSELPLLISGSRDFHAHRRQIDPESELLVIPDADHFTILDGFLDPDGALVQAAMHVASRTEA